MFEIYLNCPNHVIFYLTRKEVFLFTEIIKFEHFSSRVFNCNTEMEQYKQIFSLHLLFLLSKALSSVVIAPIYIYSRYIYFIKLCTIVLSFKTSC